MNTAAALKLVMHALDRYGILLETDLKLPSVAAIVAGSAISGSWWGHPKGHEIFRVSERLADSPDAVAAKLVSGKVTWVAKRLWPALIAIGTAREDWQLEELSAAALQVLDAVTEAGELRTDTTEWASGLNSKSIAEAVRQLEKRLLVHSQSVHTQSGSHAKVIHTWEMWAREVGFRGRKMAPRKAREQLEQALGSLNSEFDPKGRLPWQ